MIDVSKYTHSDFSIHNLPYGIFSTDHRTPRPGIAIGDKIIDLRLMGELGWLPFIPQQVLGQPALNDFIALGKGHTGRLRQQIRDWLMDPNSPLQNKPDVFVDMESATMHLPVHIGDYTDFYSSIEHATNVGKMFRDPENALLPNWKHLPVAYHGRASSIIPSGVAIHRPKGQTLPSGADKPVFGPSRLLDFELETAFIIGKESKLGDSIRTEEAEDYIFGMVLFNDWSARDIQKWEYVPLGPFLGKNFASSISPWIVPMEALEPFRTQGPEQHPDVLEYLAFSGKKNFDIGLEVAIRPEGGAETVVCRSNFKYMYWNMAQQLAHHTVNGCNVRVGDMMGSGTLSGPEPDSFGSMLELSWGGSKPVLLADGSERKFIADHDTVILRGRAVKDNIIVGFGDVVTTILPTK